MPRRLLFFLIALIVAAMSVISGSSPAGAYCAGLTSQTATTQAGGYQISVGGYQAVSGYIQGRLPDPVVNVSTAWDMLHDHNYAVAAFAQAGWIRRAADSTYYVFAAWKDTGTNYVEVERFSQPTPSLNHTYQVDALSNNAYEFSFDSGAFVDSLPGQGWWPNEVEYVGETHDYRDHFPGSTVTPVEMFLLDYKQSLNWYSASVTPTANGFAAVSQASANDIYI